MKRRKTGSKRTSKTTRESPLFDSGRWLLQREVWGLVLTATGAITIVALTSRDQGKLSSAWSLMLRRGFGIGAYPVALLLIVVGIALLLQNSIQKRLVPRWQRILGCELVFFAGLGLVHVLADSPPLKLAQEGRGGGYIGWALWRLTVPFFGELLGAIVLGILVLAGLYLAAGIPWRVLVWRARWVWSQVGTRLRAFVTAHRLAPEAMVAPSRPIRVSSPAKARPRSPATTPSPPRARRAAGKVSATRGRQDTLKAKPATAGLPPLDLLLPDEADDGDDADARLRAQTIEETLDAFGVPARVVEWSRGPVVTQFGVKPGYLERQDQDGNPRRFKIRVSKILSLQNDLALALAAAPIRIEAPVPGRPIVGIEVPNAEKTLVGLRGVLESAQFRKMRSNLRIALGRGVSGEAVVTDLGVMPHLLVAGATGSGKSVCLNAIIVSLLFHNTPDELRLLLVDPKRVELTKYNDLPHLLAPVIVDIEKVIVALRWIVREMEGRYKLFAQAKARHLRGYNRAAKANGVEPLPLIVVIIDELADLMLSAPDDVERTICRIAQMARATGIHLVIATQRPSVDVVTGLIKANFPARISFAVTSQIDSRVILDTPGAEKLLGRGDMLFMAPDSSQLKRIQGCFVSEREIEALVSFWLTLTPQVVAADEPPPWEGMSSGGDADDKLLQQAIELVREREQASASFLQRHMRIGYPRAARLIDQLEERGVVGPAETGGRSRNVLDAEQNQPSAPTEDGA